eukprot:jgi/Chlat1/1132/Chrsp111S01607
MVLPPVSPSSSRMSHMRHGQQLLQQQQQQEQRRGRSRERNQQQDSLRHRRLQEWHSTAEETCEIEDVRKQSEEQMLMNNESTCNNASSAMASPPCKAFARLPGKPDLQQQILLQKLLETHLRPVRSRSLDARGSVTCSSERGRDREREARVSGGSVNSGSHYAPSSSSRYALDSKDATAKLYSPTWRAALENGCTLSCSGLGNGGSGSSSPGTGGSVCSSSCVGVLLNRVDADILEAEKRVRARAEKSASGSACGSPAPPLNRNRVVPPPLHRRPSMQVSRLLHKLMRSCRLRGDFDIPSSAPAAPSSAQSSVPNSPLHALRHNSICAAGA